MAKDDLKLKRARGYWRKGTLRRASGRDAQEGHDVLTRHQRRMGQAATHAVVMIVVMSMVSGCSRTPSNPGNTEKELGGIGYITWLAPLIQELQNHRSMAGQFVDGDDSVDFAATEESLAKQQMAVNRYDGKHPELDGMRDRWAPVSKQILDLVESWREQPRECFRRHNEVIGAALALLSSVGDASTLRVDTEPDVRLLGEAVTTVIPEFTEALAQTRDQVTSMARMNGVVREEERTVLRGKLASLRSLLGRIKSDYDDAFAKDPQLRSRLSPQRETVSELMTPVLDRLEHQVIAVDYVNMPPDDWTPKATSAIEAAQALHSQSLETLRGRLGARKRS